MLKGGSEADANALTTMANPLTRRAWNCLAPFTEIYVHISLHDIIKNRVGSSTSKRSAAEYKTNSLWFHFCIARLEFKGFW